MPAPAKYSYYGLKVPETTHPVSREFYCIQHGGKWQNRAGLDCGNGLAFHYSQAIKLIWPDIDQHAWFTKFLETWLHYKYIGVIGPKNSGKSFCASICHLADYYAFPTCTTVMICSTTKERLEDRIWGEIKKFHRQAQHRVNWLPGHLIEGRQRLITDDRDDAEEGRDFRNGMLGVPCRRGNQFVGISDFQGLKNKRIRLCGDELAALPKAFIDAIVTLDVQGDVKVTGMGNPATTTDSLGVLCEPHQSLGGWDGGIDQTPITKTWRTRFEDGICLQLPGPDSPNKDQKRGEPVPYPYLINNEQIEKDARTWGREDWHFTMFDLGRMPRGQGSNRVLTRQLCLTHKAMQAPVWLNSTRTHITCLDAAYRAVGGDRCVLMRLAFGPESDYPSDADAGLAEAIINQSPDSPGHRQILTLAETVIVPIKAGDFGDPEDQIVMFVKKKHEEWGLGPEHFYFDAGMRTSLVSAFCRLWSTRVNTLDFGGKPSDRKVSADIDVLAKDYYGKRVTEIWYTWRLAVESYQVRGLSDDVVAEGCLREFYQIAGNKIDVETKKEMKEKCSRSPDLADCFCIGLWGAIEQGFVIRRLAEVEEDYRGNAWKSELLKKAAKARQIGVLNETA